MKLLIFCNARSLNGQIIPVFRIWRLIGLDMCLTAMKAVRLIVAAGLCSASLCRAQATIDANNLLANGGFDYGGTNWNYDGGGDYFYTAGTPNPDNETNTIASIGWWSGVAVWQEASATYQPNVNYTLTARVRLGATYLYGVNLSFQDPDQGWAVLTNATFEFPGTDQTNNPGAWEIYSLTIHSNYFTANAGDHIGVAVAEIETNGNDYGWLHIDWVQLAPTVPQITIQPQSATNSAGASATLSVGAVGAVTNSKGVLQYQWYQAPAMPLPGATNSALTLNGLSSSNAANYYVVVSNPFGSIRSSNAAVVVTLPQSVVDPDFVLVTNFQGWGTSLCWWANVCGGYANRNTYASLAFTTLGLNIVRYNIGGGENPSIPNTMQYRAQMQGFEPTNGVWNWNADENQRWMLRQAIALGANQVVAFANSPPWWMTVSGSVTGSTDGTSNNLQTNDETSFALYLATVVSNLTVLDKVHFDLVTPMNEPTAAWWVYGGSQEGCHMSADQQARVVNDLSSALAVQSPGTGIDASEDNDEQDTIDSIDAYGAAQDHVTRIATHTYGANDPFGILDLSAGLQTPAWVSEYGDGDASGITMARRVHDDITDMWVSGWIYWQVVDNAGGWGFLSNPLNGSGDTAYTVNEKFYVMAQFSRYIRPGYEILNVSDDYSLAAYNPTNQSLVIVAVNDGSTNLTLNYNLGAFARLPSQVAVLQTSPSSSLAVQPSLAVTNGGFSVTLIPQSVTTFQLNSVVPPATADTRQAWYMLEGNANDSSGNGQNGTVFGSTYVPGKLGAFAAQFNGTSSDIQIPLSISNSFTIAYWLKTTDTGGGPQWWAGKGLVDGEVPGTTNDFGTSLVGGSAALGVGNPDTTIATTNAVNDGQWHHIAATRDATTGQMLIYVDGVLQASGLGPVGTRGAPPALRVGSIQAGYAGGFYTGAIDDVQLFDNVVPAAQIPSLMNHPPFFTNAPGYFSGGEWQWSEPDPSTFATNFNVLAGNVLTVTNFASDPDLPAQTLNWSLLSAPAGANINATNGILSWRPAIAQSPSTNFVTVQVSDNGTPVMSASQTLNVVIQEPPSPQFGTTVVSNEVLFLPVSGDSGPDYVLETTTNLADNTSWTPLATNLSASPPFLWSDPITSAYREKFYRVRLAP